MSEGNLVGLRRVMGFGDWPPPSGLEKSPSAGEQLGAVVLFEPGGVASGGVCSKAKQSKQSNQSKQNGILFPEYGRVWDQKSVRDPPTCRVKCKSAILAEPRLSCFLW